MVGEGSPSTSVSCRPPCRRWNSRGNGRPSDHQHGCVPHDTDMDGWPSPAMTVWRCRQILSDADLGGNGQGVRPGHDSMKDWITAPPPTTTVSDGPTIERGAGGYWIPGDAGDRISPSRKGRARSIAVEPDAVRTPGYFTNSWRGTFDRHSTPVSVIRMVSVISSPAVSSHRPVMKWKVMPGRSSVRSPRRRLMVRSPQSGG